MLHLLILYLSLTMYNDLYSYIVYCILTNSTYSGICNQRWIFGIINKIELKLNCVNTKIVLVLVKYYRLLVNRLLNEL